jgi:hypothetical protein
MLGLRLELAEKGNHARAGGKEGDGDDHGVAGEGAALTLFRPLLPGLSAQASQVSGGETPSAQACARARNAEAPACR